MATRDTFYQNLGFAVLVYLPLAGLAFYTTYFLIIGSESVLTHLHFAVMATWLALAIVQPTLIRLKKTRLHKAVGKISYAVIPLVVVTGYGMLRQGAAREVLRLRGEVTAGNVSMSDQEILQQVQDGSLLGFTYIVWPAIFFALAMWHRRNMIFHSRYMLATILTVTGPIVDRLLVLTLHIRQIAGIPVPYVAFTLIDVTLIILATIDYRNGRPIRPLITALIIYVLFQVAFFLLPGTAGWRSVASGLI